MGRIGLKATLAAGANKIKAGNITIPDEFGEGDISERGSVVELFIPTMRKLSIDFDMPTDEADAGWLALNTAYEAGTPITITALTYDDGTGITGDGVTGPWAVLKFNRTENLKDPVKTDVTIKPYGEMDYVEAVSSVGGD